MGPYVWVPYIPWDVWSDGTSMSRGRFGPMGLVRYVLWDVNFVCTPVKGAVLINLT